MQQRANEASMQQRAKVPPLVASVPFVLLGTAFLFIGGLTLSKGDATHSWLSVQGKITVASSVDKRQSSGSQSSTWSYYPYWEYEYTVAGQRFTSHQIREGEGSRGHNTREAADQAAVSRFPVGTQVTVFYDPEDPSSAVLFRGASPGGVHLLVGTGLFLIALGFFLTFILRRYKASLERRT